METMVKLPPSPSLSSPLCSSLYHTCRSVLDRLSSVKGIQAYLDMDTTLQHTPTPMSSDPLTKLWHLCRLGIPLCTLYNALDPEVRLTFEHNPTLSETNNAKVVVYRFLLACREQLKFTDEDLFAITDIYLDDTNGFVKVVNTMSKILYLLECRGIVCAQPHTSGPVDGPKDVRDKVVMELVETERKYVNDMEKLQEYMREVQNAKITSPDTVHYLFGNLNALVDFQRRFLIQLEEIAEKVPEEQRLGALFVQTEEAFSVYEPYCSNYYAAQDLVKEKASELQKLEHDFSSSYELLSMLIKPIQRICKYPLLMTSLVKSTNTAWEWYPETVEGLDAIKRVAEKVNETQRKQENIQAVVELKQRMEDWKGLPIESHGSLLLQEKMLLSINEIDHEHLVLLFEKTLLVCKQVKEGSKSLLTKTNPMMKRKRRVSLQLKYAVALNRIVNVYNKSQNGMCRLVIEWADSEFEQLVLKFRNEEQLRQWESVLTKCKGFFPITPSHSTSGRTSIHALEEEEEDADEDVLVSTPSTGQFFSLGRRLPLDTEKSRNFHTPGMNLMPLPRLASTTHLPHTSHSGHYPASPPPSNPSSPVGTPRATDAERSGLLDTTLGMTSPPWDQDHFGLPAPAPIHRSQSHSTVPPESRPILPSQTRLRSQSSPNIHKAAVVVMGASVSVRTNTRLPTGSPLPSDPISSINPINPISSISSISSINSIPSISRLSDMAASNALQYQIDRMTEAMCPSALKVKLIYSQGVYSIAVSHGVVFSDLMEKVEKKIKLVANLKPNTILRLKYKDEDGDHITINSDDDVQMAFESRGGSSTVNIFVSL
ncbi:hypothetical protein BDF14DRAFT_1875102 [Spinellus fusiger]|nr:hypothetical protein BDF14DRAFT_1875102 [Spinellus fusiger]